MFARKLGSMTMEMDVMHSLQQVKEIHLAIISLTNRMASAGCLCLVPTQIVEANFEKEVTPPVLLLRAGNAAVAQIRRRSSGSGHPKMRLCLILSRIQFDL